ncbi:MAG: hypothetical protein A2Y82_01300 [Candidatus Buchananbacteria bacterium RBG_13_36_9]|uniref:Fido domain-containing protein n=1 Tax=Candidatus Buchananbacteria bacterium RBG_13_36_9 TaxID=1797530 RepID=A0A1G1XNV2_9BACT|nr:MAG: hypothetical protein A2Y82_01300 [Candidatus Buchananbacteria bacterium RBG_13_36_9]
MKTPYIPTILPPNLDSVYTQDFVKSLCEANRALAKLSELPHLLPNVDLLSAPLLRKEAVLSSKIEGTQTTLSELYKYEAQIGDDVKKEEAKEVENYVKAMHKGMEDITNLSLSLRTIKNMHAVLLHEVRNEQGEPGEFRNFQNYIAPRGTPFENATYVPPPPQEIPNLMGMLEKYLNDKDVKEDPIIQCALLHYQFEAIHPFGDGNGRIGRLLIPLFFYERGIIKAPLIYVSEFLEQNHQDYYALLRNISEQNDWVPWLRFFIEAIKIQSNVTHRRAEEIIDLYRNYHQKILEKAQSSNAVALVEHIFKYPYTAAPFVSKKIGVSHQTSMRLLERFVELGALKRVQGRMKRPKFSRPVRLYVFQELIDIVNKP